MFYVPAEIVQRKLPQGWLVMLVAEVLSLFETRGFLAV